MLKNAFIFGFGAYMGYALAKNLDRCLGMIAEDVINFFKEEKEESDEQVNEELDA